MKPVSGEDIARTADSLNRRPDARLIDLLSQSAHVYVDQVGARIEVVTPDRLEQHGARDRLSCMPHHEFKYAIFRGQKRNLLAVTQYLASNEIDMKSAYLQYGYALRRRFATAAQQHLDSRHEFVGIERFSQVVVTPCPQTPDPFIHAAK